jgi:hypothetical protein
MVVPAVLATQAQAAVVVSPLLEVTTPVHLAELAEPDSLGQTAVCTAVAVAAVLTIFQLLAQGVLAAEEMGVQLPLPLGPEQPTRAAVVVAAAPLYLLTELMAQQGGLALSSSVIRALLNEVLAGILFTPGKMATFTMCLLQAEHTRHEKTVSSPS